MTKIFSRAALFSPKSWFAHGFNDLSARFCFPGRLLPALCCSEDPCPPEQIERHLPAHDIDEIFDDPRKPGFKSIVMQMTQPKVLLNNITLFRYLRVSLFLIIG